MNDLNAEQMAQALLEQWEQHARSSTEGKEELKQRFQKVLTTGHAEYFKVLGDAEKLTNYLASSNCPYPVTMSENVFEAALRLLKENEPSKGSVIQVTNSNTQTRFLE
jgi:hypothetical protein